MSRAWKSRIPCCGVESVASQKHAPIARPGGRHHSVWQVAGLLAGRRAGSSPKWCAVATLATAWRRCSTAQRVRAHTHQLPGA